MRESNGCAVDYGEWTFSLRFRRWACGLHLALIAILSLLPAWFFPPSVTSVAGMDKVVHVVLYGVLGGLLYWTATASRENGGHVKWWLGAMGYGLLMEVLQLIFSGASRGFSWGDVLANVVGVAVGWLVMRRLLGCHGIHKI